MASGRTLKIDIVGDSAGAEKALKRTADATEKIGPAGKIAQGALSDVSQTITSRLGPAGGAAQAALDKVGLGASGAGNALALGLAGGAAIGGAALAKFAFDGAQKFVALAGEVRGFQRASGASAEESSRFVAVLDDMGIASDTGAGAIFKLGKAASTNAEKLEKAGIAVERNADGTTNLTETLLNAADAYKATNDPAKRTEIAFAAFGKQGQALIPVLEQGREGLRRFFESAEENRQIFSQDDLDMAREYELAMDALGDAMGGLQRGIGKGLVPVLADMAEGTATAVSWIDKGAEKIGGLGGIVKTVASGISPLTGFIGELGGKSKDTAGKQDDLAEATARVSQEMETGRERTEEQTKALDGLLQATAAQFSSELAHERSLNNLEDATAKTTEATKLHTEAVKTHGPTSTQAKAAAEELSRAQLGERDAALQAAGAAVKMMEDQARANGETWTAAQRHEALRTQLGLVRDTLAPGSPLRAALDQYITRLGDVPSKIRTQIELETEQAYRDFRQMERDFANATAKAPSPSSSKPKQGTRAAGGGVFRSTPGGRDVTLAEGGQDEAVVTLVGGGEIPVDIRRPNGNGGVAVAQRPVAPVLNVTLNVAGSVVTERQLVDFVEKELTRRQTYGATLFRSQ